MTALPEPCLVLFARGVYRTVNRVEGVLEGIKSRPDAQRTSFALTTRVAFSPNLAYRGVELFGRLEPYIQISSPPVVGPRPGFVPSITASCPSIVLSKVAEGTGVWIGRDGSACGAGDGRSWTLLGGKVGLFVCEELPTLPRLPDEPDES
jgi:hypothetical protein